jgi:DNA-binding helix-hairpin-helix protein with protein kinase domain
MPQQFYIKDSNEAITIADKPFASGGEGALFNIISPATYSAGHVAKIIHPQKLNPTREAKVLYLINNRPKFEYNPEHQPIIWIEKALYNEQNNFVGFIMPRAIGEKLEVLCAPRLPKSLGQEWQQLQLGTEKSLRLRLKVCYNIAAAVQMIHATNRYVLVDLKPDNVMIQPNGLISIVDTDSVEVVENGQMLFSATVATPDYTPPEYYSNNMEIGKTPIDESWDRFSLAVIFYRIMLGIHPFAASCNAPYDNLASLSDKIKYGFFVHDADKLSYFLIIPAPHAAFKKLDEEIQQLYISTFDTGHHNPETRATPIDWLSIIPNSTLSVVDRPLPSENLNIPNIETKNWYEIALQQTLQELNLVENYYQNGNKKQNELTNPFTATLTRWRLIKNQLRAKKKEYRKTIIIIMAVLGIFFTLGSRVLRVGIPEIISFGILLF